MTRPDWCPQRVWDEARSAMNKAFAAASAGKRVTDHETIARAILAAEQREREAIKALLARDAPHSPRRYIYDPTPDRRIWACDQLDQAIANRGSEND